MDLPSLVVVISGVVFIVFLGGVAFSQKLKEKPSKPQTPPKKRRK